MDERKFIISFIIFAVVTLIIFNIPVPNAYTYGATGLSAIIISVLPPILFFGGILLGFYLSLRYGYKEKKIIAYKYIKSFVVLIIITFVVSLVIGEIIIHYGALYSFSSNQVAQIIASAFSLLAGFYFAIRVYGIKVDFSLSKIINP